jgi:glucosamine--fructose-6-phosphate aminotransferase (isomerizing)
MCGCVAGFIDVREGLWYLEKLLSRGADSFGFGFFDNKPIQVRRDGHNIDREKLATQYKSNGNPIIFHNRWASQGEVRYDNTHPFLSEHESILLVHNGTVNDKFHRKSLESSGWEFNGTTDSETLCQWIESYLYYGFDINDTFQDLYKDWEGTWALLFLRQDHPNRIYFAVKDSPLYFSHDRFCSEAEYFEEYYKIPNNSWGWLERRPAYINQEITCYYQLVLNGEDVKVEYKKGKTEAERMNVEELSYQTRYELMREKPIDSMLAEIRQQAEFKPNLVENSQLFKEWWTRSISGVSQYKSVLLFGMGSSYNAALLGRKYFRDTSIHCSVEYASEYHYSGREIYEDVFRLAITQSGETADTREVLQKLHPAHSFLLTNHPLGSCGEFPVQIFPLGLVREAALAATGTFSATVLTLLAFANYDSPESIVDLLQVFQESITFVLAQENYIKELALSLANIQHSFVLGHDYQYPVARESALKLKEIGRIMAEASPIGEHRHGSIVLQNRDMCNFVLLGKPDSDKYKISLGNCEQIKARHGHLVGVGVIREKVFDEFVEIPSVGQEIHPLICNVVMQLLSYYIAKHKGLETTYITNLAKTVTVL